MSLSEYHKSVSKPVTIRGVTYPSRWAAAKALGTTQQNVCRAVREGRLDTVATRKKREK